jgi:hypothetical protein
MKTESRLEEPKDLLDTLEQSRRKHIGSIANLVDFGKLDEDIAKRLIKTANFELALLLALRESLLKRKAI